MAINKALVRLLIRESKRRRFDGTVLQLGRQEVWTDDNTLMNLAALERQELAMVGGEYATKKSKFVDCTCMDDVKFFKTLGFSSVHSTDLSAFEGADFLHDMNLPIPPEYGRSNKYDVIYDGGTMEHVFHIPNFLENVHDLLAVNGRIIHSSPIDYFSHGFYNFSTCLFEDFYRANKFEINICGILKYHYNGHFGAYYYTPGNYNSQFMRSLCQDTFDKFNHTIFFVATKMANSTGNKIPTQCIYQENAEAKPSGLAEDGSRLKAAYGVAKSIPVVNSLARYLRDEYARSLVKWEAL